MPGHEWFSDTEVVALVEILRSWHKPTLTTQQ
jgi:hypothetical protein